MFLHDHEPSQASFAVCFKSLLPASEECVPEFPSPKHLSSTGSYPLDLSGLGNSTGSDTTVGLALRFTETHKPFHHDRVKIPLKGDDKAILTQVAKPVGIILT